MTSFLLQLLTFLKTGHLQIFLIFFLLVQLFWWLRVYIASKNKLYTKPFRGNFSVIVAVLREDPEIFEKSLKSIKRFGKPSELIVSIDDYTHADAAIKKIAKKYATHVIEQSELLGKREQYAICVSALKTDVDVIVTVDSDTIWDKTTINILKPFTDQTVGAASGRQTIFNVEDSYIRRIAEWFEDLRFRVTLPFQSYFGQVNVIPGRTLAVRAELYKTIVEVVRNETFLGRRIITSDDASVTMEVLKAGYRTVYQEDSSVSTDAPNTLKGFLNQYLRWYRGAYRRFFSRFSQLVRMNPLVFLSNLEFLFFTFIYTGIVITFIFKLVFHVFDFGAFSGIPIIASFNIEFFLLLLLGYFASSYLRNLPHLMYTTKDFLFLPVFAIFTLILMAPLKIISAFGMFENGWMTRLSQKSHRETGKLITRTFACMLSLLMLALTIPLAYLVDIAPAGVPFSVIVADKGPAYYKARQVILSYQNTSKGHASLASIEVAYDKHNETKDHTTIDASRCVQDKLTFSATSADVNDPFAVFDACHAVALQKIKAIATQEAAEQVMPVALAPITLTVTAGDSQSTLVNALIAKDSRSNALSPAQKAYLENRLVNTLGNMSLIYSGQVFHIDQSQFTNLIKNSTQLSPLELQAWQQYI